MLDLSLIFVFLLFLLKTVITHCTFILEQSYLEEKEAQWSDSRDQYQAEIVQQGLQITSILQKLHIQNG